MDSAVTCRTLPWGSRPSSCQGPVRFFVVFAYWAIPEGVVHLRKATFALAFLVSSYFVVLSAYDGYASTFFTTSGPIEWILGGVQGIFKNHSEHDSACDESDGKLTQLVLIE